MFTEITKKLKKARDVAVLAAYVAIMLWKVWE